MTNSQYLLAWAIYLVAACVCLLVLWRFTRGYRAEVAAVPRMVMAVILLTPILLPGQSEYYVPAFMVVAMEPISGDVNGAVVSLQRIITVALAALVGSSLWFWNRRRRLKAPPKT